MAWGHGAACSCMVPHSLHKPHAVAWRCLRLGCTACFSLSAALAPAPNEPPFVPPPFSCQQEAAALQELLWEWVMQGISWPSVTTVEGCPFTCLSPLARLCPNLKSLTAVVYESSAITGPPIRALSRLTALETLRITAERSGPGKLEGQPGMLAYEQALDRLAAAAPRLRTLQLVSWERWRCGGAWRGLPHSLLLGNVWGWRCMQYSECSTMPLRAAALTGR